MANVEKQFITEPGKFLYLFPDGRRHNVSLANWAVPLRKTATEQAAPNLGRYDVTLDDMYRYWLVFEGEDQPTDWDQWVDVVDLEDETVVDWANSPLAELIETVGGVVRFKQAALAQVVRWVSGPVLPNEPYPPARRLGTRNLTLFNGEILPVIIPLEHLDSETLSAIEDEELQFVVETARKVTLLSQLLTVENGSISVPSTVAITASKQSLQWSLRWPTTNAYITGGRITVAYAPIQL